MCVFDCVFDNDDVADLNCRTGPTYRYSLDFFSH